MRECPRCSSPDIHRSHARTLFERLRRSLTEKRLFRCHKCNWRGWGVPMDSPPGPAERRDPVDLDKLDADIRDGIDKLDAGLDSR